MMNRQTWFVTGAASQLGADIVRGALAAGHRVVAADRDALATLARIGPAADARLLVVALDEVDSTSVAAAVQAGVDRFGAIDVAVHGAAACSPRGPFAPRQDFSASVRALFNVTRGVLATMREQRAGRVHHLVPPADRADRADGPTLFSIPGFCAAVSADVAPFGVEVAPLAPQQWPRLLCAATGSGRDALLQAA